MATADLTHPARPGSISEPGNLLQSNLGALARRRNSHIMLRALLRAAVPGAGLAALAVLAYRFYLIDGQWWMPAAMVLVSLIIGARNGRLEQRGTFAAAIDADQKLAQKDRFSSALAFVAPHQINRQANLAPKNWRQRVLYMVLGSPSVIHSAPMGTSTNFVPALIEEAAMRSATLDPKRMYPLFPWNRGTGVPAILCGLLAVFCLMPDIQLFRSAEEKKLAAVMALQGKEMVAVAKKVQKDEQPNREDVKRLSRKLEKLGQQMMRGRMTKRVALTQIGELRKQLQKAGAQNPQSSQQDMPQIAEALKDAPLQSAVGRKVQQNLMDNKWEEAAKMLDDLADKMDKGQLSQQEKEKAAQDMEKVAADLRQRGGQANKDAAQQLENAAKQLRQPQEKPAEQPKQPQGGSQNQSRQPSQDGARKNQQNGQQGQQGSQNPAGQLQQQQSPKQGQGQQPGQNGGPQQQQQGRQNKQGKQQGSSQGGQQGGRQNKGGKQSGQQQGQGQQSQGQSQGSGNQQSNGQGASDALRNMANGLRSGGAGGGGSQNLQNMLDKLREAENQTGSNGGSQSGMGKMSKDGFGEGNCPGGNCRRGTPGKDLMASDPFGGVSGGPGLGPRNHAQGSNAGGGVSRMKSNRTGDKRRYADVWSDRLPRTHKKIDRITGKWGDEGEMDQLPTRGEAKGGPVKTPYYEVYESYKRDMEESVGRESVPPAYKQPVKDYFESIKP